MNDTNDCIKCYQLRYVFVNKDLVGGRPIEWDSQDDDGYGHNNKKEDVNATKWHTTCPSCASLIEFSACDISSIEEDEHIRCSNCNAGIAPEQNKTKGAIVKPTEEIVDDYLLEIVDPIKSGLMVVDLFKPA